MATRTKPTTTKQTSATDGLLSELPMDRLKEEVIGLGKALAKRGVSKIGESLTGATGKLGDLGDAAPGPGDMVKAGAKAAAKAASPLGPVKGAASKVKEAIPGVPLRTQPGPTTPTSPAARARSRRWTPPTSR